VVDDASFTMIGLPVDFTEVHNKIVAPYITAICENLSNRFGDATGNVSVACSIFEPKLAKTMSREEHVQKIRVLAQYLNICQDSAVAEWNVFRAK
jgi:hypothetical protein